MAITSAGNTLILNTVIATSINDIDYIALINSGGEYFRKAYASKTVLTTTKYKYTFYMNESEGNDTILSIGLCGAGATITLDSGTTFATNTLLLTKTTNQSLYIIWTIEII